MSKGIKPIPSHPGYWATWDGKIWNTQNLEWLESRLWEGYPCVNLQNSDGYTQRHIHQLVLEAFVGPCPEGMECRHLDGNRRNNYLENLVWGTHFENVQDSIVHGTYTRGEKNGKLTAQQVIEIRKCWLTGTANQIMLAKRFGVSNVTISNVVRHKTYKEVL